MFSILRKQLFYYFICIIISLFYMINNSVLRSSRYNCWQNGKNYF
nr:MAG TPA: hypothetical protein [Caudoviricetes sp.]